MSYFLPCRSHTRSVTTQYPRPRSGMPPSFFPVQICMALIHPFVASARTQILIPLFTGFMGIYCLNPSLPLYLTIPSSIETNFDCRYSSWNVAESVSNSGCILKSLSKLGSSRGNMFSRLFKWRYCRIFSKRFLSLRILGPKKSLVSGRDLTPNNTFNAMNALISWHMVSYQLGSGFVQIHCWAILFVCSTIFAKSSSGQRRKKKSIAFPSSGTLEVGPVGSTKSSTSTGESSLDQKSSSS